MRSELIWDEFRQAGTDYESVEEVEAYDERMSKMRNVSEEVEQIIGALGIEAGSTVVEIGTGTGEFAISAAERGAQVVALDISETMLEYARQKAERRGVGNIRFVHGGFLTYLHDGPPVDVVVTQLALHHLPDFWKGVALARIYDMLRPGGKLFLKDVVFPGDVRECEKAFEAWIQGIGQAGKELERHIRCEYSTMDWIMEGLLKNSGFSIMGTERSGFLVTYVCRKT